MTSHDRPDLTEELSDDLIPPEAAGKQDDVETPPEVDQWVDETKGVERIISVAISTSKPRTAEWISDQAVVAEKTARDHLETFAELGVVASFTSSGVTRYHADEAFIHYREVSRCTEQYTKDELSEKIEQTREAVEAIRQDYDVKTPDELRAKAAEDEGDIEMLRSFKKAASEWETLRDRLEVYEDALRRFDKFDRAASAQV